MKAYDQFLLFLQKNSLFVLGVAHGHPSLLKLGQKMEIFKCFRKKNLRTTGFQLLLLIVIESLNIFHWNPAKKIKVGVVLGKNLGQIRSNVVKKVKKQALSIRFFHILHGEYLLKQKVVVVQVEI